MIPLSNVDLVFIIAMELNIKTPNKVMGFNEKTG
jgi:hypothetical protein